MKKRILGALAVAAIALTLVGCENTDKGATDGSSSSKTDEKELVTLKVGASPTPHAEILEYIKPKLKEEGIDLKIVTFDDYVLPNDALNEKEIDANYFQHVPFFDLTVKETGYDFINKSKVHIELMALYSNRLKDIKDLKDGDTILTSNSESDWGRIITILQDADLVTVKEGTDLLTATFEDIVENPKNLKFKHDVNPELLTTAYENDEAALIAINANFAGTIELAPEKDGVLIEKDNSPYANIIAIRSEDDKDERIAKLVEVLHEKDTQDWILKKWDNKIKPVDE